MLGDQRTVGRSEAAFGQSRLVEFDVTGVLRLRPTHRMTPVARGGAAYGTPQVLCSAPPDKG